MEAGVLVTVLGLSIVAALVTPRYADRGLQGHYWTNAEWRGAPARVTSSAEFTVPVIRRALRDPGLEAFSAEWTGYLFVDMPGRYTFAIESDAGAEFYLDARSGQAPFLETSARRDSPTASRPVVLSRGPHSIRLRYTRAGDGSLLDLTWTPPGGKSQPLPDVSLSPDAGSAVSPAALRRRNHAAALVAGAWIALLLYLPVRVFVVWFLRQVRDAGLDARDRLALAGLGVAAAGLCAWGVTWGLPGWFTWAADEIGGGHIEDGLAQWFSSGWFQLYAPLHYYVLAIPVAVVQFAQRSGLLFVDTWSASVQLFAMRSISVLMGLGTLGATYLIGVELSGPRRAWFGAAALLFTPTLVYYAKTANVDMPYVFWLSLSFLAFVRIVRRGSLADHVALGVTAAAAVGTKDQAYGFYVLVPFAVLALEGMRRRQRGAPLSLAVVWDRKLLCGAVAAVITFALIHNLAFNMSGFVGHVRAMLDMADGSRDYPPTVAGQMQLAVATLQSLRFGFGWPMSVLALAGIVSTVRRPERRWWLWLLVPIVSYYVTTLCVVLYVYDRFMLGAQVVLALFAGSAAVDLLTGKRYRAVWVALVAAVYGFSALNAASVNVMMTRDARYAAGAWVARCIPARASLGVIGSTYYSPHFASAPPTWIRYPDQELRTPTFDFIVVNTRYARRLGSPAPGASPLTYLNDPAHGYRRVARFASPLPWWAVMGRESAIRGDREFLLSNIPKINPETVVFARGPVSPACSAAGAAPDLR